MRVFARASSQPISQRLPLERFHEGVRERQLPQKLPLDSFHESFREHFRESSKKKKVGPEIVIAFATASARDPS